MNMQQFPSNDLQTLERKLVSCKADLDGIATANLARDDLLRECGLNRVREQTAQRTRAEVGIKAFVGECSQRGQRNLAGGDRPVPHINGPDVLSAIATHAPSQSHWHNTYLPYGTL